MPTSVRHVSSRREMREQASTSTSTGPVANGRPCASGHDQTVRPPSRRGLRWKGCLASGVARPRWKAITLLPDKGRREVEGEKAKNMWLWSSRDLPNSTAQHSIDLKYFLFWSPGSWVSWEAKPSLRMARGQEAALSLNP